ncbi:exonuclease domain-containing protein [Nocardia sp. NPDC058640]|uniref:exonuclease domain-containing protein n=1 Tax=Nocardia sp. NPDC058640 TaxID=3346571 RepID=UPI00365209AF
MFDYTALDFETANSYRGSPCSVGLVRVRGGRIAAEQHWLIRPPERVDHFDAFNSALHGITAGQVANAPRWKEIMPSIVDFIGDDVVVAHNAGFDTGVIRYACAVDDIEWPQLRFLCTLVLARRVLSLPSYRLPFVLESLGSTLSDHHHALADARAVTEVVRGLAAGNGAVSLHDLADRVGVRVGTMQRGEYRGSVTVSGRSASRPRRVRSAANPDADPDGHLFDRVVVFTGTLMSMTRRVAQEQCASSAPLHRLR